MSTNAPTHKPSLSSAPAESGRNHWKVVVPLTPELHVHEQQRREKKRHQRRRVHQHRARQSHRKGEARSKAAQIFDTASKTAIKSLQSDPTFRKDILEFTVDYLKHKQKSLN
jgi:hypothetical protein